MAIKIEPRVEIAPTVQAILTKYGCIIQTRLGLHEASKTSCSNSGLVILNLIHGEIYTKEQAQKRGYKSEEEMWANRLESKKRLDDMK